MACTRLVSLSLNVSIFCNVEPIILQWVEKSQSLLKNASISCGANTCQKKSHNFLHGVHLCASCDPSINTSVPGNVRICFLSKQQEHQEAIRPSLGHGSGKVSIRVWLKRKIPQRAIKFIIRKWKESGTTVTSHRRDHKQRVRCEVIRALVRETIRTARVHFNMLPPPSSLVFLRLFVKYLL